MPNSINAIEMAGNVAAHNMSIINLILQADLLVKSVMLILLFSSIWCWAIIFEKFGTLKNLIRKLDKFERKFWSGYSLNQLYEKLKSKPADNPLAAIFLSAMNELSHSAQIKSDGALRVSDKARIEQAMYVTGSREINKLSKNIGVLATVNTSATYIGLFGTVWGIMSSFQAIAASKNTTLAVVAPGIAEALLATAMGLLAAIPAGIFYNILTTKINYISNNIENFTSELSNLLAREINN